MARDKTNEEEVGRSQVVETGLVDWQGSVYAIDGRGGWNGWGWVRAGRGGGAGGMLGCRFMQVEGGRRDVKVWVVIGEWSR